MRKLLAFFLFLVFVFSAAVAEENKPGIIKNHGWEYVILDDGTIEIRGVDIYFLSNLVIPEEIDGVTVSGIGDGAFKNSRTLMTVSIPDTITHVGINPFMGCQALKEIKVSLDHPYLAILDGVLFSKPDKRLICYPVSLVADYREIYNMTVETYAYAIPNGIREIGAYAFYYCDCFREVIIPDSVVTIGGHAFSTCHHLLNLSIPESVTYIGPGAFEICTSLMSVTVPKAIKAIEDSTFGMCSSLKKVILPEGMTGIGSGAFSGCSQLKEVTIPETVAMIGQGAFSNCEKLCSISIPDWVTEMGDNPFNNCAELKEIHISPDHPYLMMIDGVLFSKPDKRLITYPCCLEALSYTIPDGVQSIDGLAFCGCNSLESVEIPDSVILIGTAAFSSCSNLKTLVIPDSVKTFGTNVFYKCFALTVTVGRESAAMQYCKENGIQYIFPDTYDWLND